MNPNGKILIIGGTGLVGSALAKWLRRKEYIIQLLVRDVVKAKTLLGGDFNFISGDITDYLSVEKAMEGMDVVIVSITSGQTEEEIKQVEYEGLLNVIRATKINQLQRIFYVSGMFNDETYRHTEASLEYKYRAGKALMESEVPYTIFRPTYFMETLQRHVQGSRAMVIGKQSWPLPIASVLELAQIIDSSVHAPETINKAFYIVGPERWMIKDALKKYVDELHPAVRVMVIPLWIMKAINKVFMKNKMYRIINIMEILYKEDRHNNPKDTFDMVGMPVYTLEKSIAYLKSQTAEKN